MSARRWIAVFATILGVAAVGSGVAAVRTLPGPGRPLPGMFVGGGVLPADQNLGSWLEHRRAGLAASRATVAHGMKVFDSPLGELGVELDVARTMRVALEPGRHGSLRVRWDAIARARKGEIDIPVELSIDRRKAEAFLATVAPTVRREPIDARLDLDAHLRIPDVPGEELDVDSTIDAIVRGAEQGHDVFAVVTRPVTAKVTEASLGAVDITKVVAAYETRYSIWGDGAGRAVNIANASKYIDGTVLMPGQEFSFNNAVGPRRLDRGFTHAPEIVGDELQTGVGGGVCQAASTLYAAAMYAALEVQERWAHGRPSSYTKLGLDATVSYGSKDLRMRNTLPFPVLLHVYVPKPGFVRAEVLGGEPIANVEYIAGVARSYPFDRRVQRKPFLAGGKFIKHQKGIKGYSVYSLVKLNYLDGRTAEKGYSSEYRPTPEIFWVSDDYDESQLPDLPEGAKGAEPKAINQPAASAQPSADG